MRDKLKNLEVAAHSYYHEEALEEDAAQEAFALLSLLATPEDRVSLRFLLGFGSTNWLAGQYAKLRAHCAGTGLSPKEVLDKLVASEIALPGTSKLATRYQLIATRLQGLSAVRGQELIDELFPEGSAEKKLLRDSVMLIIEGDMDPAAMLERLRNLITQPEVPENENFVRIMSLQKSKGLTSKVVVVLGCIEGLVPYIDPKERPAEQQQIELEQRRLFYVAMTRPTEILVLSSFVAIENRLAFQIGAKTAPSMSYGTTRHTVAGRFLSQLGPTTPAAKVGAIWAGGGYC